MTTKKNKIVWFRRWIWITLAAILIFLLIILIVLKLYLRLKHPYCGSNFNPNMRYCDPKKAKLKTGDFSCDPKEAFQYNQYITQFLEYLHHAEQKSDHRLYKYFSSHVQDVTPGLFYFAIPELLKLLPTDFGQNQYTPYGILSFFNAYPSCISYINSLCHHLFQQTDENKFGELFCVSFLRWMKERFHHSCPFPIKDINSDIVIEDVDFFNEIGLLGSFSMRTSQVTVLSIKFPVKTLDLNYWSFNLYLSDSLDANARCYPYRQTLVASIAPPFNIYTAASYDATPQNPILKEFVSGFLIIASDKVLAEHTKKMLADAPFFDASRDFLHIMPIPSGKNSMIIDPELPNPNSMASEDPMFHPEFQRLSLFLRLSPKPSASTTASENMKNVIYLRSELVSFEVLMINFPESSEKQLFGRPSLPLMIDPPYNEIDVLQNEFRTISNRIHRRFWSKFYWTHRLACRNSVANLFAPLYRHILKNPDLQYKGGYQAIQMAGNGQGDNYDAQYRASGGCCLGNNDVLLSFSVNHAFFGNCISNSINLIDLNKAYGFASVQIDEQLSFPYYIVLFSRSNEILNRTETIILSELDDNLKNKIKIYKIFVRTGPSLEDGFPICHQALLIERVYLNTNYVSKTSNATTYNLYNVFGENLSDGPSSDNKDDDRWKSLSNVVAPKNNLLIKPFYLRMTYSDKNPQTIVLIGIYTILILFGILIIGASIDIIHQSRNKSFKK